MPVPHWQYTLASKIVEAHPCSLSLIQIHRGSSGDAIQFFARWGLDAHVPPGGSEYSSRQPLILDDGGWGRCLETGKTEPLEESRRGIVILLDLLQLENMIREGRHHRLRGGGDESDVELKDGRTLRVAGCLGLRRPGRDLRVFVVIVLGFLPLPIPPPNTPVGKWGGMLLQR